VERVIVPDYFAVGMAKPIHHHALGHGVLT